MSTHFILARNTRRSHKSQMWHLKWSISVDTNEGPTGVFPIPTPIPSSNPSPCPTPFKLNEMRKNGNNLILSDFQADMYYIAAIFRGEVGHVNSTMFPPLPKNASSCLSVVPSSPFCPAQIARAAPKLLI